MKKTVFLCWFLGVAFGQLCPLQADVGVVSCAPIRGPSHFPWNEDPSSCWTLLDQALHKRGEKLVHGHYFAPKDVGTLSKKKVDIVFFNDLVHWTSKPGAFKHLSQLPGKKILLCWEPRSVLPQQYTKEYRNKFDAIFTWNPQVVDNKKIFQIYYPKLRPMRNPCKPFSQRRLLTQISTDRSSPDRQELYSLRRNCICYFDNHPEKDFIFYGQFWNKNKHRTYGGEIGTKITTETGPKIDTLENFKFSLCFENTYGTPGYITEKIFDCFTAGCIPIYYGAPDIGNYIPSNCYISWKEFDSIEHLYQHLEQMSEGEYLCYLENIRRFIASDKAKLFTNESLVERFLYAIDTIRLQATTKPL